MSNVDRPEEDIEPDISGSSSDSSSSSGGEDHMNVDEDEQLAVSVAGAQKDFDDRMTEFMNEGRLWQHSGSGVIRLVSGDRFMW